jgi:hypothetical protein
MEKQLSIIFSGGDYHDSAASSLAGRGRARFKRNRSETSEFAR